MTPEDREKARESARKYAKSEKGKATVRAYYEKNKESIAARHAAWHQENKENTRGRVKKWEKQNKEKLTLKWKRYADRRRLEVLQHCDDSAS